MGYKAHNLEYLLDNKINVHHFKTVDSFETLKDYSDNHQLFTIRFDSDKKIKNLPFYVYNAKEHLNDDTFLKDIVSEAKALNCTLLCSDGYMYDSLLKFNFVIEKQANYDFIMEICSVKVPLRTMYEYKTTIIKGNILERRYNYINREDNIYTLDDIEYVLDYIMEKPYSYLEGTLYQSNVGVLKEPIVIWQTD